MKIENEIQLPMGFIGNKDTIYLYIFRDVVMYFVFFGLSFEKKREPVIERVVRVLSE